MVLLCLGYQEKKDVNFVNSKLENMMKALIIFIFIISSSLASSEELSCSLKGTAIHFVNGIANTEEDANLSIDRIEDEFKANPRNIDRIGKVYFDYSYNETHGAVKDLLESGAQKIQSAARVAQIDISIDSAYVILFRAVYLATGLVSPSFLPAVRLAAEDIHRLAASEQADVERLKTDLKKILEADKKLIIVSHSQGNMVTNRALREIQLDTSFNYEFYEKVISNVRFATPEANAVAYHSSHVMNTDDFILYVSDQSFNIVLFAPEPEFELRPYWDSYLNHNFLDTYFFNRADKEAESVYLANLSLTELRQFSISKIIESALTLDKHPRCPRAIINYSFSDLNNNLAVNFDSTDPEDPAIEGLMYIWDFGDFIIEGPISSKTINHIYPEEGTYTVKLRVTDAENNDFGEQATSETTITVGASILGCYGYEKGNYHLNPDGTLGGFVANTASVSSTVTVPVTVSICGSSQILGSTSLSPATDSYIFGEVIIRNSTLLDTSIEGAWYMVLDSIVSNSSFKNGATLESSDINRLTVASGTHIRKSTVSDVNYSNPDGGFFFDDSNVKNFVTNARITVERSEILNTTYLVADPVKTLGVRLTGSNIINCAINGIVGNYPYIEYANLTGIAGTFIRLDISLGTTSAINQVGFPDWSGESYLNYPYWQSI